MKRYLQFSLFTAVLCIACSKPEAQGHAPKAERSGQRSMGKPSRTGPPAARKKQRLTRFSYRSFQEEVGSDSNSQTEIISFDGKLLSFTDVWGGYHPSGHSGEMPAVRYELSAELLVELENYFRTNNLLQNQKDELGTRSVARRNYRRYGHNLTLVYKGKTITVDFAYKTSGVRVDEFETKPLNKKLNALKTFLESIRAKKGAIYKEYTKKEIEDRLFLQMNGHRQNETPTTIQRFDFRRYSETLKAKKGTSNTFKHPQFSVNAHGPSLVVAHRSPTAHRRSDCTMSPRLVRKFLKLLIGSKIYQLKTGKFLAPDMPGLGMKTTKYEFKATFRRGWKVETYLHFYDTPDVRERDRAAGAWIPKFESFDREFRKLLESKGCPKTKY